MCVTGRRVQGGEARRENLLELPYCANALFTSDAADDWRTTHRWAFHIAFHRR